MIDVLPHWKNLNYTDVKKYCGVSFYSEECRGDECRREDHPLDKLNINQRKCSWMEEKILVDEVVIISKNQSGKEEEKKIWIPIRWYNFTWSVHEVQKNFPNLKDFDILIKAIQHAKLNCFDPVDNPNNMASRLGYTSYSKFLTEVNSLDYK